MQQLILSRHTENTAELIQIARKGTKTTQPTHYSHTHIEKYRTSCFVVDRGHIVCLSVLRLFEYVVSVPCLSFFMRGQQTALFSLSFFHQTKKGGEIRMFQRRQKLNETSSIASKAYVPKNTLGKVKFGMCEEVKGKIYDFCGKV